ncbi:hypothetical protein IR141_11030 [Neisseria sp. 19428wB4_WF04]|nr:hypothetical protein [Neisseria sp. 19428wB4_WF04]TFU39463.1 hypothetical protein E4T99_10975 [Neisseria sp. WF04]
MSCFLNRTQASGRLKAFSDGLNLAGACKSGGSRCHKSWSRPTASPTVTAAHLKTIQYQPTCLRHLPPCSRLENTPHAPLARCL